jgi:glucan endo-1,3-alpha-glucosidase
VRVLVLLSIGLTARADELGRKLVFAHYLVTNQDYQGDTDPTQEAKIAAYEKEIQQAQSDGIDGFALNVRRMTQPDLLHPVLCADLRSGGAAE